MSKGSQITLTSPTQAKGNGKKIGRPSGKPLNGIQAYEKCRVSANCDTCPVASLCVDCLEKAMACLECSVMKRCALFKTDGRVNEG